MVMATLSLIQLAASDALSVMRLALERLEQATEKDT